MLLTIYMKYSSVYLQVKDVAEGFNLVKQYKNDGFDIESWEVK